MFIQPPLPEPTTRAWLRKQRFVVLQPGPSHRSTATQSSWSHFGQDQVNVTSGTERPRRSSYQNGFTKQERRGPGIGLDPRNPARRIRAAVREREQRVLLRILSSLNDVDGVWFSPACVLSESQSRCFWSQAFPNAGWMEDWPYQTAVPASKVSCKPKEA